MTTACAWCDSVQSVDLVALCRSGLSHGVCVACMPGAFGQEACDRYIEGHPERGDEPYENPNLVATGSDFDATSRARAMQPTPWRLHA
jgi:hypothetical protein